MVVVVFAVTLVSFGITENSTNLSDRTLNKKEKIGGDFTLTDYNGQPFSLKSQRGKLVLIFFGYTYCPDICPTELSSLSRVLKSLDKDADKVKALFISVDPERDTPEKMKQYVPYYNKDMIGLTGSKDEIEKVAKLYHVQYKIHDHKPLDQYYLVDHSASLYVVNVDGKLAQIIPFGLPVEHIQRVVNELLSKMQ